MHMPQLRGCLYLCFLCGYVFLIHLKVYLLQKQDYYFEVSKNFPYGKINYLSSSPLHESLYGNMVLYKTCNFINEDIIATYGFLLCHEPIRNKHTTLMFRFL